MNIDIAAYPGDNRKPVVILIHELGMDKTIWENPTRARFFGGSLPVSMLLTKPPSQKHCGCSEKKPYPCRQGSPQGHSSTGRYTVYIPRRFPKLHCL